MRKKKYIFHQVSDIMEKIAGGVKEKDNLITSDMCIIDCGPTCECILTFLFQFFN